MNSTDTYLVFPTPTVTLHHQDYNQMPAPHRLSPPYKLQVGNTGSGGGMICNFCLFFRKWANALMGVCIHITFI